MTLHGGVDGLLTTPASWPTWRKQALSGILEHGQPTGQRHARDLFGDADNGRRRCHCGALRRNAVPSLGSGTKAFRSAGESSWHAYQTSTRRMRSSSHPNGAATTMMIAADRAERSRSSTNAMAPPDTNCARTAGSFFSIGSRQYRQSPSHPRGRSSERSLAHPSVQLTHQSQLRSARQSGGVARPHDLLRTSGCRADGSRR